ncbi:MAG: tetratricopeptide repeat protein [Candidatus Saccharibacteria bacterium]
MKTIIIYTIFLMALAITSNAQNERKFVRQGNKYYEAAIKDSLKADTVQFNKAEIEYRKALEKKPDDTKWNFNLADALYKQNKFDESAEKFKDIADKTANNIEKSRALHNMGNALLMNNKLDESIASYKQALRNNPNDLDTKYNLLYAMNMKKKKDQQKKNDQNKDKNKDQNKDQNKDKNKDKNKDQNKNQNKDQQKNKDQQNKDQQNANQQPQQSKISKQNAEQMLQALENDEKKTQEKVKKIQALKAQSKNVEKDW